MNGMRWRVRRVFLLAATALSLAAGVGAQGPLTPPGPPGPTMKTLDQIEPRTPIYASQIPLTISNPGSYYLAEQISISANNTHGITIDSDRVTIDLNGFAFIGPGKSAGSSGEGIRVTGSRTSLAVRNGTVAQWRGSGVNLTGASNSQAFELRVEGNGGAGVATGVGGLIIRCAASDNGGSGIVPGDGTTVQSCVGSANDLDGFTSGFGVAIFDSTARSNARFGFALGASSLVRGSNATTNGSHGILAIGRNTVLNNQSNDNGLAAGTIGYGIEVEGAGNRIDGNQTLNNDRGINVIASHNVIVNNTSSQNRDTGLSPPGPQYSIVDQNAFGVIVTATNGGLLSTAQSNIVY